MSARRYSRVDQRVQRVLRTFRSRGLDPLLGLVMCIGERALRRDTLVGEAVLSCFEAARRDGEDVAGLFAAFRASFYPTAGEADACPFGGGEWVSVRRQGGGGFSFVKGSKKDALSECEANCNRQRVDFCCASLCQVLKANKRRPHAMFFHPQDFVVEVRDMLRNDPGGLMGGKGVDRDGNDASVIGVMETPHFLQGIRKLVFDCDFRVDKAVFQGEEGDCVVEGLRRLALEMPPLAHRILISLGFLPEGGDVQVAIKEGTRSVCCPLPFPPRHGFSHHRGTRAGRARSACTLFSRSS